jgi:uncharacterized protein (TIGR02145 family)
MKKLLFFSLISFNLLAQTPGAGVTDIDGNQYATVIIGTQEWMAENLRTSKYANGDVIPNITDDTQWATLTTGAWVYYNNDSQYENPYGKLYNWFAVSDPRNVCPTGWHVPSDDELMTMFLFVGSGACGKVKTTGTIQAGTGLWEDPNLGATNSSGFSAIPAGVRDEFSIFLGFGQGNFLWSSSEANAGTSWLYSLSYADINPTRYNYFKPCGFSIRCLKGAVAGIETIELPKKTLLKITDILGRDTEFTPNTVQIYHYSDGTVEKVLTIE